MSTVTVPGAFYTDAFDEEGTGNPPDTMAALVKEVKTLQNQVKKARTTGPQQDESGGGRGGRFAGRGTRGRSGGRGTGRGGGRGAPGRGNPGRGAGRGDKKVLCYNCRIPGHSSAECRKECGMCGDSRHISQQHVG
jgi:hypothetical protein